MSCHSVSKAKRKTGGGGGGGQGPTAGQWQ